MAKSIAWCTQAQLLYTTLYKSVVFPDSVLRLISCFVKTEKKFEKMLFLDFFFFGLSRKIKKKSERDREKTSHLCICEEIRERQSLQRSFFSPWTSRSVPPFFILSLLPLSPPLLSLHLSSRAWLLLNSAPCSQHSQATRADNYPQYLSLTWQALRLPATLQQMQVGEQRGKGSCFYQPSSHSFSLPFSIFLSPTLPFLSSLCFLYPCLRPLLSRLYSCLSHSLTLSRSLFLPLSLLLFFCLVVCLLSPSSLPGPFACKLSKENTNEERNKKEKRGKQRVCVCVCVRLCVCVSVSETDNKSLFTLTITF